MSDAEQYDPGEPGPGRGQEGALTAEAVQARIEQHHDAVGKLDSQGLAEYDWRYGMPWLLLFPVIFFYWLYVLLEWRSHSTTAVIILLIVGAGLTVLFGWVTKRTYAPQLALMRERHAHVVQVRRWGRVLAGVEPDEYGQFLTEDTVPVKRQVTVLSRAFHRRFPVGPAPHKVLAKLSDDANPVRLAFHRYVGWGTVPWLVLAGVVAYFVDWRVLLGTLAVVVVLVAVSYLLLDRRHRKASTQLTRRDGQDEY